MTFEGCVSAMSRVFGNSYNFSPCDVVTHFFVCVLVASNTCKAVLMVSGAGWYLTCGYLSPLFMTLLLENIILEKTFQFHFDYHIQLLLLTCNPRAVRNLKSFFHYVERCLERNHLLIILISHSTDYFLSHFHNIGVYWKAAHLYLHPRVHIKP